MVCIARELASQKFLMDRLNPFKKSYEKGEKRAVEMKKTIPKKSKSLSLSLTYYYYTSIGSTDIPITPIKRQQQHDGSR